MGPLSGIRVLEFEAIGPGPFCNMMLADMGADVLLVDRPQDPRSGIDRERWYDVMLRGRRSVTLDLKSADGVDIVDKPGGLNNASAYVGLVPERKVGLIILTNRGDFPYEIARNRVLPALSRLAPEPPRRSITLH